MLLGGLHDKMLYEFKDSGINRDSELKKEKGK
jgi:hypothetical protein